MPPFTPDGSATVAWRDKPMVNNALDQCSRGDLLRPVATNSVSAAFHDAVQAWHDRPFLCVADETARNYRIPAATITYGAAAEAVALIAARYQATGYGT